jgi:hypothetical protein
MKHVKLVGVAILLGLFFSAACVMYGQVLAKQYKTIALGPYSAAFTCLDGGKATIQTSEHLVVLSCPVR